MHGRKQHAVELDDLALAIVSYLLRLPLGISTMTLTEGTVSGVAILSLALDLRSSGGFGRLGPGPGLAHQTNYQ